MPVKLCYQLSVSEIQLKKKMGEKVKERFNLRSCHIEGLG